MIDSAVRIAAAVAGGELSSADIVEQVLQRIAEHNPRLNAFTTVTAASACPRWPVCLMR